MERGDGFYFSKGRLSIPMQPGGRAVGGSRARGGGAEGAAAERISSSNAHQGGGAREQDQYMPIANVIRIMRRIIPVHAKISDDAKETIQECVSEFISFITGEANDRCRREQRKTITAEDLLWAMGKLGFDDYVEPLTIFLNRYREIEGDRSSVLRDPVFFRRTSASFGEQFGGPMMGPGSVFPMHGGTFVSAPSNAIVTDLQGGFCDPMVVHGIGYSREDTRSARSSSSSSSSRASMLPNCFDTYGHFH